MSARSGHYALMLKKGLAPLVPARYWRMLITATTGANYVEVRELVMRETPGQPPMATGGSYLLYSSQASGKKAFYAFDNGYYGDNPWRSSANPAVTPQFIGRDYEPYAGKKTTLRQIDVTVADHLAAPRDFQLQYSLDNAVWVSVMNVTGQEWTPGETRVFTV